MYDIGIIIKNIETNIIIIIKFNPNKTRYAPRILELKNVLVVVFLVHNLQLTYCLTVYV